jgi:hypothetical protein
MGTAAQTRALIGEGVLAMNRRDDPPVQEKHAWRCKKCETVFYDYRLLMAHVAECGGEGTYIGRAE